MIPGHFSIKVGLFFNHADIIGGGELSFIDLADAVRKYGITPTVFVPGTGEIEKKINILGIQHFRFPLPPIRWYTLPLLPFVVASIVVKMLLNKIDIAHINGARSMLLAGTAAVLCKIPVIWHVRVMERDKKLDFLRSLLAKVIIVNSHSAAYTLKSIGICGPKIRVIYNGIDIRRFSEVNPADLQHKFGLPDLPIILAVGRLCEWKRFHILVEACAFLDKFNISYICLIVGNDAEGEKEYCNRLRSMPSKLGLDNVVFLPFQADIASIMKSAALLVLPSRGEAFGRVIIEAWACGLPVVAADIGGPSEIITDGENGLLFPVDSPEMLAQKIYLLLNDTLLRNRLSFNGLTRVKDFSLDTHAREIVSVYKKLVFNSSSNNYQK